jgi:hypothetical protein
VRGRDEIDITASAILQFEHRLSQLLDCDRMAVPLVADVEVLAEHTAQIAAGKEYCAGAAAADQYAFLAEMRTDGTNNRDVTNTAEAYLSVVTMDFTFAGTKSAGIH